MMKWKVVKNPRSFSADRSVECLRNDVRQSLQLNSTINDSNNNVGEESKQDNGLPPKDTNRQRESSLVRKPSIVGTDCINLKSILGLTRQRSETNLSSLGLISAEPRRCRSEVRGASCDRLTVGYHTVPEKPLENGKTRCSSPPSRSGWLRGRKRERESRNPLKNNQEVFGKTVVSGSSERRTSSKSQNVHCRTIVDGSDCSKQKNKLSSSGKSSLEPRKCKGSRKSGEEDIIEEEIYTEIDQDNVNRKLMEENNKETVKEPNKVIRKKGLAPKPQITKELFKDTNSDVNLNPNGRKASESPISFNEVSQVPPNRKPHRKNQTYNGRDPDIKAEIFLTQSVKLNNLKNCQRALVKSKNNVNVQSVVAVAEIHGELLSSYPENENENAIPDHEAPKNIEANNVNKCLSDREPLHDLNQVEDSVRDDSLPFHIDTPDYSTLDSSVNGNHCSLFTEDVTFTKEDIINCKTDCNESLQTLVSSDDAKVALENSLSSILRDSTGENNKMDSEPKKTVRFHKLDLIEKYKKHKTESCVDAEDDAESKSALDINSNEIDAQTSSEDFSQCSERPTNELNGVVRNPSPVPPDETSEDSPTPFVVKKSFVLTIAKQEKGFKSLCANKKPEPVVSELPIKPDQQISVTFLCSGPPTDGRMPDDHRRLRSTSVPPPRSLQSVEMVAALPSIRGRSRERRSKERQHCKKNHRARKKDAVFVMPQAVIDELSQVLEKRKPSLDEILVHP